MRPVLIGVGALVAAGLGVLLLLGVFSGAEDARTDVPAGPGRVVPAQTGLIGALVWTGNVVIAYRDVADARAAQARARAFGGDAPALVASGQGVLARPQPIAARFAALAYRRELPLASLDDPRLDAFVDRWLGEPVARDRLR